jgi:hypothetical protein
MPKWKLLLGRFRLLSRLLRLEPVAIERLSEGCYVVSCNRTLYHLDERNEVLVPLLCSREGFSNPLNICSDGYAVYWGEYGGNSRHDKVNIYRLGRDLSLEVVYSFPQGVIRHIHNIIWDKDNELFYILTGDLERTSGIYTSNHDWTDIKPLLTGSQQYRAVIGFPYKDGLIYATDSVDEENNIYLLQHGKVSMLAPLSGSCIYGTETRTHYIFSTTVESPEGRGLRALLSNKLGDGIKDRKTHLVVVRKDDLKVEEVLRVKKDPWPMKLFLYGTLMFPKGQEESDDLWYYVMACKGDGLTCSVML